MKLPSSIESLITEISYLPSIGRKTAQRLAFFLLKQPKAKRELLAKSLLESDNYYSCKVCGCLSETDTCILCNDHTRDKTTLCVVEEFLDLFSIEETSSFTGLYHVLGGVISPIDNIGPNNLNMKSLFVRLEGIKEIIIATNTTFEGEATALFIKQKVKETHQDTLVSRIARGLPMGADIEYADGVTLQSAFEGRKEI